MELAKQNTVKRNLQLNLAIAFLALLPPIQLDSICVPATVPLRPHPPPHLFFSHLCVSATTPATTTFAAPTHPCSCDRLYVCLSGNANGNILASTSLFATDSNITSFSLLFFFLLPTFCAKFNCNENVHCTFAKANPAKCSSDSRWGYILRVRVQEYTRICVYG